MRERESDRREEREGEQRDWVSIERVKRKDWVCTEDFFPVDETCNRPTPKFSIVVTVVILFLSLNMPLRFITRRCFIIDKLTSSSKITIQLLISAIGTGELLSTHSLILSTSINGIWKLREFI